MSAPTSPRRHAQRGFTLLSVMLALILVLTVLLTTLRDSSEALTGATFHRDRELMGAAVDSAISAGVATLNRADGSRLLHLGGLEDTDAPLDIFRDWTRADLVSLQYPPPAAAVAEMAAVYDIRVGAVRGQRVRPPAGEDVRTSHGSVVHLQISVRTNRSVGSAQTEQRYEVGVRVPESGSYQ